MKTLNDDIEVFNLLTDKFGLIGESETIQVSVKKLLQVAPTDLTVLITGETGTGKEVFAQALHGLSNRRKFPFIGVNCGAIPETLLESELFGHERGAFTGAVDQRKGFFEVANKGTIFLDEIGEIPASTQVKLLRILESGEFTRLGSSEIKRVDVRICAATNRELEIEVQQGKFRQDLFFRLNSVRILLPPLRSRIEDIGLLVDFFGKKTCAKLGIDYKGISADALNILYQLRWQGNVRELKNLIDTVITLEKASYITPEALRNHMSKALPPAFSEPVSKESSIIPFSDFNEPKRFELEILFRTLLELKNDMTDIKRALNSLTLKTDTLKFEIMDIKRESLDYSASVVSAQKTSEIQEAPEVEIEDFNLIKMEKSYIIKALKKNNGNRRATAKDLGLSERTLYRKIQDYDIEDIS